MKKMFLVVLVVGCTARPVPVDEAATVNSVETVIADMQATHEAAPAGVPDSYDWAKGPRMGAGNSPGRFGAITAWGQLYEAVGGNPASNTRVQFRRMKLYVLSKREGKWRLLQQVDKVEGAAYREDFVNDESKAADVRNEPDGTVSVKAGNGYNYHFWPPGRAAIDSTDIGGVFSTVQARLIPDNPSQPDDRDKARYLLSMGADYWLDLAAQWDNFKTNGDVAIGRFKLVTKHWKAFNMTSLPADALRRNSPPLE